MTERQGEARLTDRHGQGMVSRHWHGQVTEPASFFPWSEGPGTQRTFFDPEHLQRDGRADIYNVVVEMEGQIYIH